MPLFGMTVVHLDLKDYIDLAKEIKAGRPIRFDRLLKLVGDKKILVASSGMLIQEILSIKDPAQKLAIADAMAKLSQTFIVRSYDEIKHMEFTNNVADYFKLSGPRFNLDIMVYGVGYMEAIGHVKLTPPPGAKKDPKLYAEIEALCLAELLKNDILARTVGLGTLPKLPEGGRGHQEILDAVAFTRKKWEGKSFHQQEKVSILELGSSIRSKFDEIATSLDIRVNGLHPLYPDEFGTVEFLSSLPTLYMWDKLHLYLLHKDKTKTYNVNHLYDIGQLSVAVPYCDVVVCDKEMARVIRQSKVDQRYSTQVFERLNDAIEYLEA